jgi:hypothetical protein
VALTWAATCTERAASLYYCPVNSGDLCSAQDAPGGAARCRVMTAGANEASGLVGTRAYAWSPGPGLTGPYHACIEDDKVSGDGVDVQSGRHFAWSAELCFQKLALLAPEAGATYAHRTDNVTFSYTEACHDAIDVYSCGSSASTAASCSSHANEGKCFKMGAARASDSYYNDPFTGAEGVYAFRLRPPTHNAAQLDMPTLHRSSYLPGAQYACVEDQSNAGAFAFSGQFCVQELALLAPAKANAVSPRAGANTDDPLRLNDGLSPPYVFTTLASTYDAHYAGHGALKTGASVVTNAKVDTVTLKWTETCTNSQTLYLCTESAHLNTCGDFVARGLCFESAYTEAAATNQIAPKTTELLFYPNRTDHGRVRVWMGPLYFCVQDHAAFKTKAAGVTRADTYSEAASFYTAAQFCVQSLGHFSVVGSSGIAGSTTYALVSLRE